jgi:hypothetical protein
MRQKPMRFHDSRYYSRRVGAARRARQQAGEDDWIPEEEWNALCKREFRDYRRRQNGNGALIFWGIVALLILAALLSS